MVIHNNRTTRMASAGDVSFKFLAYQRNQFRFCFRVCVGRASEAMREDSAVTGGRQIVFPLPLAAALAGGHPAGRCMGRPAGGTLSIDRVIEMSINSHTRRKAPPKEC